jgi:hypothetical protein
MPLRTCALLNLALFLAACESAPSFGPQAMESFGDLRPTLWASSRRSSTV